LTISPNHPVLIGKKLLQDGMQGRRYGQIGLAKLRQNVTAGSAAVDPEFML